MGIPKNDWDVANGLVVEIAQMFTDGSCHCPVVPVAHSEQAVCNSGKTASGEVPLLIPDLPGKVPQRTDARDGAVLSGCPCESDRIHAVPPREKSQNDERICLGRSDCVASACFAVDIEMDGCGSEW